MSHPANPHGLPPLALMLAGAAACWGAVLRHFASGIIPLEDREAAPSLHRDAG
jgi:hypothetical protein